MNKSIWKAAVVMLTLSGACATQAHARPPTVQNSPGYERALKESRANYLRAATPEPAAPAHLKKKRRVKPANQR